ncbi:MAG: EAL domain-containing protein [Deferribacterota bacterium]|nr:EAL domain-containing protein [Deferribacterota bacterium]
MSLINSTKSLISLMDLVNKMHAFKSEKIIYENICRIMVDNIGLYMARIFAVDEKSGSLKKLAIHAQDEKGLAYQEKVVREANVFGKYKDSLTAKAYFQKKTFVINDTLKALPNIVFMDDVERLGYNSFGAFPLIFKDQIYGVLTLFSKEKNFFDGSSVKIIELVLANAALAIYRISIERQRESLIKKLTETNKDLEKMSKFYRALSEVNQLIIRANSKEEIEKNVCRVAVECSELSMSIYCAFNSSKGDFEKKQYYAVNDAGREYYENFKVTVKESEYGRGNMGVAFRERRVVVINNALEDQMFAPWAKLAKKVGFKSVASFPVYYGDNGYGVLTFYSDKKDYFDKRLVDLLDELSRDLAFAFYHLEINNKVLEAEKTWRIALDVANEIIVVFDFNENKAIKSDKFYEILDYNHDFPEEDTSLFGLVHPDDRDRVGKLRSKLISGQLEGYKDEIRLKAQDGTYKYFLHRVKQLEKNRDGSTSKAIGVFLDIDELKRKESQLEEITNLYKLLADVNAEIFKFDNIKKVFELVVKKITNYLDIDHVAIVKINKKTHKPVVLTYSTVNKHTAQKIIQLGVSINVEAFDTTLARAYKSDSCVVVDNLKDNRYRKFGVKSVACIPIKYESTRNYMVLCAKDEDYFDDKKLTLFNDLVDKLSYIYSKTIIDKKKLFIEKKLALSEERWRAALDNTNEGVWLYDIKDNKVFYSDKWKEMLKYSKDEIPDKLEEFWNRVHPEDVKEHRKIMDDLENGRRKNVENTIRLRCKDGSYIWILVRGAVYRYDKDGKPLSIIGTHTDVTELKKTNEELIKLNNFYRALVEASKVLISEFQIEKVYKELCRIAVEYGGIYVARILTIDKDILSENACYIRKGFEEIEKYLDYVREAERQTDLGKPKTLALHVLRKKDIVIIDDYESFTGVPYPIKKTARKIGVKSACGIPIMYNDQIAGVFILYSDVTHYFSSKLFDLVKTLTTNISISLESNIAKTKEDEYKRELELVYSTIDKINEAIIITDKNNNIVLANESFEKMFGYSESEVIGKNPSIISSSEYSDEFFNNMRLQLREAGYWQGEIRNRKKDGSILTQWVSINAIKDENNKIKNYIAILTDLSPRKEMEDKIIELANYDILTGLPNRSLFIDRLTQAIAAAKRYDKKVGVIYLDIDNFKSINDNLGYNTGDKLIKSIAGRLKNVIRGTDTISRLSSDDFYIILNDIYQIDVVHIVVNKLYDALKEPFNIDGYKLYITVSAGITIYPDDGESVTGLLRNAETALFFAKEMGRNTFQFFNSAMTLTSKQSFEIRNMLKKAIENKEFVLYYQPKVSIKTNEIIGAEALIRWQSPEKGLIPPNEFIPIAETSGLIRPIGQWVLEEACRQIRGWQARGIPNIKVSVNVSTIQFQDKNLSKVVEFNIKQNNLKPEQVELELTESIIMRNIEDALKIMNDLKLINVILSVDDFGTGFSSLSYIQKFPIDIIKIDKSFVSSIENEKSESASIVKTIIELSKNLGIKVVAEGVETKEQLELLKKWGCDEYQGYYFSKPIPAEEYEQLFKKHMRLTE